MRRHLLSAAGAAALAAALAACQPGEQATQTDAAATEAESVQSETSQSSAAAETRNPLLADWDGPYGGVPAFDEMSLEYLPEAIRVGIERRAAEYDAIANNPEPATFENTIVAMERAGDDLGRVFVYWGIWSSNLSSPEFREIQRELAPEISAASSAITQNQELFARVRAVYEGEEMQTLRPDQQRLVQLTYDSFARNGATLTGDDAERYAEIQQRLSELHTQFSNNVLADEEGYVTYLSEDQLSGLPESFVRSAASLAAAREREGEYAVLNTRSSMDPFLTYSDERDLRETVWRTYYNRGDNGDEHDNNAIIAEILQLRDERVELLGYDNYAQWRLENRMAGTPERAMELMLTVWPASVARVEEEVAQMEAVAAELGHDIGEIQPWDYRYYMEKVRQREYDLNSEEVKQYFSIDALREAMFFVSGELFGFAFEEITDGSVPVFHEDVRVWEVTDSESGDHIGLWYLDPFARPGKRSGAWATSYRGHTTFDGQETVLSSNNSNFIQGAPGEPVLISFADATTFFHEMGHALHALSSNVAYPTLNGGVRDYTEFQSQLLERWVLTDEVIDRFLRHAETGEPMPDDLVDRIRAASTFNQGFATTEYLASALVDMAYHTTDPEGIDPDAFERETLEGLGMPDELPMRHRSPHFGHIFSGEGYSAGYYGYMWADVLTSDAAEAFAEAPGGFYDAELAERMVETLFAPRNSIDPAEAYRQFRGRDATVEPLMRDRGFPVPGEDE
ncbi:MAG: M3 family metallopeptidase [Alphaproteobacteria bacterium]|nr:M3 family metallopeptidase [Alphaproteobacteria bacterium]